MSYTLQAIIGSQAVLGDMGSEHLVTIALTEILNMVPLTADVRNRHDIPYLPLTDDGVEGLPHSLNQALRHFGILPGGHHDEFAAVGLGRFRDTDDWAGGSNP